MDMLLNKKFVKILEIFVSLFGLFMIYQVLLKIFEGSWVTEAILIGFLTLIVTFCFTITIFVVRLHESHKHLNNQFRSLAYDFKAHRVEFSQFENKINNDLEAVKKKLQV